MRIACLQFAPQVGDVDNNLNRADSILNRVDPEDLDLLVLPELAFTGYNFSSLSHISPFLEHSESGITALWTRTTALKYDCTVIAGYPEKVDLSEVWPANPEYYNSAIVVNSDGETVANYRKTHLYYTDETWALEGPRGFFDGRLPGLPRTAIGICMDINPYRFQTPWDQFEFAYHVLDSGARLVVLSMAWLTQEDAAEFTCLPQEPDMNTMTYWISRLEPIIKFESNQEIIVVFANRTGIEGNATYAGTSAVVGIQNGEVRVYGILGRGEKDLLVVDTNSTPLAKLVYRPEAQGPSADEAGNSGLDQPQGSVPEGKEKHDQHVEDSGGGLAGLEPSNGGGAVEGREQSNPEFSASPIESRQHQAEHHAFFRLPGPMSPSASESRFSISSFDSSHLYWLPSQSRAPPAEKGSTPFEDIDDLAEHGLGIRSRQENRLSIRSDVSVWNNQPGRPRDMTDILTPPFQPPVEEYDEPIGTDPRRQRSQPSRSEQERSRHQQTPQRTPDRHGRNSARERVGSAARETTVHAATPPKLKDLAPRGASAGGIEPEDLARWMESTSVTTNTRRPAHSNAFGDTSVYPGTGAQKHRASHGPAEPPILQPASRNRVDEGSGLYSSPEIGRPATEMERRSARDLRRQYQPARSSTTADHGDRANSRGRHRSATANSDQPTDSPGRQSRQRSAQATRGRQEQIDLSQFRLIEEYPSANCPVHGSRSRSGTPRRTPSRQETPGTNRRTSRARDRGAQPDANQGSYGPPAEKPQTRHRGTPPAGESLRRLEVDKASTSKRSPNVREPKVSRQLATRSSTIGLRQGPKTPTAMVLVEETLGTRSSENSFVPLRCLEKSEETPITRPRSAIW